MAVELDVIVLFFADRQELRLAARARKGNAYRQGTVNNVNATVSLFLVFTEYYGFKDLPATASTLTCFGEFLLRSFAAPSSICNALANLRHFHLDAALATDAFDSRAVFLWKRAIRSTVRHVPHRAPPLPVELLEQLCALARRMGPLGQVFAALAAVLFFSMARLSSLLPSGLRGFDASRLPTWGDVRAAGEGQSIKIKWAKNLQVAGQGFTVPLAARPGSQACQVDNLTRLRRLLGGGGASTPFFLLPNQGSKRRVQGRVLTMRVARLWLRLLLHRLGEEGNGYTFHSFRRGACSLAFEKGAAVEDIKELGGWRSEAVRVYLPPDAARRRVAGFLR